jgi:exosortase
MQEHKSLVSLIVHRSGLQIWPLVAGGVLMAGITWPIWQWMWREWMSNDYYSHGILIEPVALYLASRRVAGGRAAQLAVAGDSRGLLLLAASLGLYLYFLDDHAYYLAAGASVGLLGGLVWTLAGRQWVRLWAFPLSYLLLMVPLPFLERITYPLALLTGISSVWLVRLFGVEVTVVGNAVTLPNADLVIGAQCSGINSMLALVALNALVAYGVRGPGWGRVSLVGLAVPLAMAGNILRVAALLVVARAWGAEAAFRFYHDYSGIGFFMVTLLLLLPLARLLQCKSLRHEVL